MIRILKKNNEEKNHEIIKDLPLKTNHNEVPTFRELSKESNEHFSMNNEKIK